LELEITRGFLVKKINGDFMIIDQSWYRPNFFKKIYYSGFSKLIISRSHKFLEKDRFGDFPLTLELGGTHGQHLEYIKHSYKKYILSDLILNDELTKKAKINSKVQVMCVDVNDIDKISTDTVDRVVLTCLLHHIDNADLGLQEIVRVLKPNKGIADILLPNEPSVIWNLGRVIFIIPKVVISGKTWKEYWKYVELEHINNINNILISIEKLKTEKNCKVNIEKFPFNFMPMFLTVFMRVTIQKTD